MLYILASFMEIHNVLHCITNENWYNVHVPTVLLYFMCSIAVYNLFYMLDNTIILRGLLENFKVRK